MIVEMRTYSIAKGSRVKIMDALRGPTFEELKRIGVRCAGPWASTEDDTTIFWMRGFPDEAARESMTSAFYGGAAWTKELADIFMPVLDSYDVVAVEADESAINWTV